MTREDALALLKLAKRQMRDGCVTPPVDSQRIAERFVRVVSKSGDDEAQPWARRGAP